MFNRRVPKTHPRVEILGSVDELTSALGLGRSMCHLAEVKESILAIQKDLIGLMGELATLEEDVTLYRDSGFSCLSSKQTARLDALVQQIESQHTTFRGWAIPGENPASAALDLARTICRRVERQLCMLETSSSQFNKEILVYLNRLGDVLWLLSRREEE